MKYDISYIREQFPSLKREINGFKAAYFDGAAGTQVPQKVVDKISDYLIHHNANKYGFYATSLETHELLDHARETMALFLGCERDEISFGYSSTTNNFMISQAIARDLKAGDEIVITDLDHECNRSPWIALEDKGVVIKSVKIDKDQLILDMDDLAHKITDKTKVVAIGYASNGIGTINDVETAVKMAHEVGAYTVIDAVHYASHKPIDVKKIDTDFLFCSAYKFFGAHLGILYTKSDVAKKLKTLRIIPNEDVSPGKFETGTPNFAFACGAAQAVEFIADVGVRHESHLMDQLDGIEGKRRNIVAGMLSFEEHEDRLSKYLVERLRNISQIKIYAAPNGYSKTPTVSFTIQGISSEDICKALAKKGLFVANGHFLAFELIVNTLGLGNDGVVRVSFAPYNTQEEVERLIQAIEELSQIKR